MKSRGGVLRIKQDRSYKNPEGGWKEEEGGRGFLGYCHRQAEEERDDD
jgi:hypothetical protein